MDQQSEIYLVLIKTLKAGVIVLRFVLYELNSSTTTPAINVLISDQFCGTSPSGHAFLTF
jgi:hypothetical protein